MQTIKKDNPSLFPILDQIEEQDQINPLICNNQKNKQNI